MLLVVADLEKYVRRDFLTSSCTYKYSFQGLMATNLYGELGGLHASCTDRSSLSPANVVLDPPLATCT